MFERFVRARLLIVPMLALLMAAGCTRSEDVSGDPKKQLQDYISKSFSVRGVEDRAVLLAHMTGEAKQRLSAWSEEQFLSAFTESKRQFVKLVFAEIKPVSKSEVSITYELTYLDQNKGHDAKVTNKKLCQMVLENGKWLIADVRNIKELVEYRNEMSLP